MQRTKFTSVVFAIAAAAIAATSFTVTDAEARGGKEIYQQSYEFDQPMHGFEGHSGRDYYCTYKRFPIRKCKWNGQREVCKVVKWELEQTCY